LPGALCQLAGIFSFSALIQCCQNQLITFLFILFIFLFSTFSTSISIFFSFLFFVNLFLFFLFLPSFSLIFYFYFLFFLLYFNFCLVCLHLAVARMRATAWQLRHAGESICWLTENISVNRHFSTHFLTQFSTRKIDTGEYILYNYSVGF